MEKELVVITGGPGTGKTTIIDGLIEQGYSCFPEISRQITLEAKKQGIEQLFLEKPLLFSELLLEGRRKQYQSALQDQAEIVFLDRGIPDILAYMHYIGDSYPAFLTKHVMNINIQKYLSFHHGKKSTKVTKRATKTSNKPHSYSTI